MGLTECASVAFSNPLDSRARKIRVARHAAGVEARVVDPSGCALADGERGEIEIRGANVMLGYFKSPEATAAAFAPADGSQPATSAIATPTAITSSPAASRN